MSLNKFIDMIDNDSMLMARNWAKGILTSKFTKTYRQLDEKKLIKLGKSVYENLAKWLDRDTTKIEIGKIYAEIGKQRYKERYPLCEVLYAAHYEKKVLAEHISSAGLLPDALNLYHSMQFMERLYDFFDIATFYLSRGYQEALYKEVIRLKGIDDEKVNEIFPEGSFYYEKETELESLERLLNGFNLFKIK